MCKLDWGDFDTVSVSNEEVRKSRKEHRCSSCNSTIHLGESYLYHFSVSDGQASSEKLCGECHRDRDEFCSSHNVDWLSPSWWLDLLVECIAEGDEESETKWKPMLVRWQERYDFARLKRWNLPKD